MWGGGRLGGVGDREWSPCSMLSAPLKNADGLKACLIPRKAFEHSPPDVRYHQIKSFTTSQENQLLKSPHQTKHLENGRSQGSQFTDVKESS